MSVTESLRRAHEATTQGEWAYTCEASGDNLSVTCASEVIIGGCGCCGSPFCPNPKDAHFIALAHKEVPALCDRVEALEAENARLREELLLDAETRHEIARQMDEGAGFWRHCSGCIGTHNPRSQVLRCDVGMGCRECGGFGVIWDDTDYNAIACTALGEQS